MCDVYLCVSGRAARVIEPTLCYSPLLENLKAPLFLCYIIVPQQIINRQEMGTSWLSMSAQIDQTSIKSLSA